ncbi:MAG: response regulator [Dehalococcoidia bacterium]|nr:response regulator [Dehalococcoidia bacterium]
MTSKTKRMLLVDDAEGVRRILGDMLRIEGGFDVDTTASGPEALEMLNKNEYDVLLVDLNMPVMSGIELYRCMRKEYPDVAAKVVFMSADIPAPQTRGFFINIDRPFLPKPFTIDDLMNAIRSCNHGARSLDGSETADKSF